MTIAMAVLIIGLIVTLLPMFTTRVNPVLIWIGNVMFIVGLAVVVLANRAVYLVNP